MKHQVNYDDSTTIHKDRILLKLKDHHWHTKHQLEDFSKSERVASRIHELKQEGYEIDRMWHPEKKRVYMYRLVKEKA